jgi:3-isopropylmalate/(R)-2-methylmalate dehydratase small subunit
MSDPSIFTVTGRGLTLRGDDIDTDQILPARFLKAITFQGMEAHIFADNRKAAELRQRKHPIDDPKFAGATILLVNRNFGCGSSREHAPQGLKRFGFQAIIGESFGEIFAGNCVSVGMPCIQASAEVVATLQRLNGAKPVTKFTLDLTAMTVTAGDDVFPITLAEGRRRQFVEGSWDPTAVLLSAGEAIEERLANIAG